MKEKDNPIVKRRVCVITGFFIFIKNKEDRKTQKL